MERYAVTRTLGIDAGHRIMTHGSKCRSLHGHRYEIEVTCEAPVLHDHGEQTDMVVDFSFIKEEMLRHIDEACDHGFIACARDEELLEMFRPSNVLLTDWLARMQAALAADGWWQTVETRLATKLYVVPFQPTAECLARHWFGRLEEPIRRRSDAQATLTQVKVWETPNCFAVYRP